MATTMTDLPFAVPNGPPYVAGIDPGFGGAIAFLTHDLILTFDMPTMAGLINVDAMSRLFLNHPCRLAICERAASMPKQGIASTFKFGMSYGAALAVPCCLQLPLQLVAARVWKKHFGLNKDKEAARALAIRLWPGSRQFERKKDHNRAEAALIARYGWEKFNNRSGPNVDTSGTADLEDGRGAA
jgi:hypothetical protein